jgi:glucokinase
MKKTAIGIDIGGTRTKAGLVDLEKGIVLDTIISPTEKKDSDKFLNTIGSAIDKLKEVAARQNASILGVGFGVTSFVFEDGMVDSTYGFLEFMEDYPLAKFIENHSSLPCRADNDARVVALGEALYGKGKGYNRVLVLTLGTGLGLGFVANGRFETHLPYAHMGGHMSINPAGLKCYCGKIGCLESLVSAPGIVDAANRLDWATNYPDLPLNVETIFKTEQLGNPLASSIVKEFLGNLKTGIDNYINLFAPDIIIIGGGIAKGMEPYLDKLTKIDFCKPFKSYSVKMALSDLDEHSGILGSAALFNE